jgi:hypothetical protein
MHHHYFVCVGRASLSFRRRLVCVCMSTRRPACLQFPAPHRSDSTQPRQMSVCAFGAHAAPPPMERTRKQRRRTSGGHDRSPPSEGRQCRRRAASREHSKGRLMCRLCSSLICRYTSVVRRCTRRRSFVASKCMLCVDADDFQRLATFTGCCCCLVHGPL